MNVYVSSMARLPLRGLRMVAGWSAPGGKRP
jgi:hypothetical protein